MTYAVTYERAHPPCSGSCRPGTLALMHTVVASHPRLRTLGCYNCRPVRNSTTLSVHAVGRATDIGFLAASDQARNGGQAGQWLQQVCDALIANYQTVGCQQIIYAMRIWRVGDQTWRPFSGSSGTHHDHAHIELVSAAAETLTADVVAGVLATIQEDDLTPEQAAQLNTIQQLVTDIRAVQENISVPAVSPDSRTQPGQVLSVANTAVQAAQAAKAAAEQAKSAAQAAQNAALAAKVAAEQARDAAQAGGLDPTVIANAVWSNTRLVKETT